MLITACFMTIAASAQGTIGSSIDSQVGALLDLKEKIPGADKITCS
jgi:uncharacterized membrane protein